MAEEERDRSLHYLKYIEKFLSSPNLSKRCQGDYKPFIVALGNQLSVIVRHLKEGTIEISEPDRLSKDIQTFEDELSKSFNNLLRAKVEQFSKNQEEKQVNETKQRQEKYKDLVERVERCQNFVNFGETPENFRRPESKKPSHKSIEPEILTPLHDIEVQEESEEFSEDELHKKSNRGSISDSSDLGSDSIPEHTDLGQYTESIAPKEARGNGSESLEGSPLCSSKSSQTQPENGSSQPNKDAPFTKARYQGAPRKSHALETMATRRSTRECKQPEDFMKRQYENDQIEKEKRKNKKRKPKE